MEPTLVILSAGIGSRFGGLKQIRPVDQQGHTIIDFSLFDAYRAGFRKVVFVIKHEIEADFKAAVGRRMEKYFDVKYVFQQLDCLPEGCAVPEGRAKPWGTGHAVACCAGVVDGPFAVINADDFYGPGAFSALYGFLKEERSENEHAMVAYLLRNTVTENGYVARGVCRVADGFLTDVVERTLIEKRGEDAAYTEDGEHYLPLSGDSPVSMNCWAFGRRMLDELVARFPRWFAEAVQKDPLRAEYFLPSVANALIQEGRASVRVLPCAETWHGITYQEDLPDVIAAVAALRAQGVYPASLLD
ncbi:MAG: nucleotidyltransferase [Oscillospiraceae bacterium]|nr:nucleotidyltransferase [Oscillospiraceae bacterium]